MNMRLHVAEGVSFWQTQVHPTFWQTQVHPTL